MFKEIPITISKRFLGANMTLREAILAMKNTDQIKNKQTILQHGLMVFKYAMDLKNYLEKESPLKYQWRIPDWFYNNKDLILKELVDFKTMKHYCIFHDIGKPYCKGGED